MMDTSHEDSLSSPGAGSSRQQTIPKRAKTGCITCRVRKKRCDERKPHCASCERLGIECLGYSSKRPGWLRGDDNKKKVRADLKKQIMSQKTGIGSSRGRDESTDHEQEEGMHDERMYGGNGGSGYAEGFNAGRGHGQGQGYGQGYGQEPMSAGLESYPRMMSHAPIPSRNNSTSSTGYAMPEMSMPTAGIMPPTNSAHQLWNPSNPNPNPNIAQSHVHNPPPWDLQPLSTIPSDQSLAVAAITESTTNADGTTNDATFEDVWRILFGDNTGFTPTSSHTPAPSMPIQDFVEPDPTTDLPLLSVFSPSVYGAADNRHVEYLHHYLNVVLPLQYRFGSRQLTDLIGPLAMTRKEVLTSAASLAALHLVAQRTQKPLNLPTSWTAADEAIDDGTGDHDTLIAKSTHRRSIERLRFISSEDLTSEDVIVSALFAISFHLFSGGTSREWREVMLTSQRCLSAALSASPELNGTSQVYNLDTPWARYKPLIAVMVWMDILGSITLNKASRLLPTYRRLLDQRPMMPVPPHLHMANVMGCDNTTMLALAETVQLSEWKEYAESTGCLSVRELLRRAAIIETLLQERSWREGLLDTGTDDGPSSESPENQSAIRVMREIFYGAAKLYLATVINGPYPRVMEVATAVQDVTEALRRLDQIQGDGDINRSLVFPITLAGCHCETPSQQTFFRNRFQKLGGDASAFGNSRQALQLMEEVWRKRAVVDVGTKVCWRGMMKALGWDCGILLI